jgi:hypothetical protein
MTVRHTIHAGSVIAAFVLIGGCTHLGTFEVVRGSSKYPAANPGPRRVVLIRGTIAPTLTMAMSTIYRSMVEKDCWTSAWFSAGEFEGAPQPLKVAVPMSVARDGNSFSAALEVNRFLPGKCGWHFASVEAQVSNGHLSDRPETIIQPYDPISGESKVVNSSLDPVILRCRDQGKLLSYRCMPPFPTKSSQYLVDTTTVVYVEINDDDSK